MLSYILRRLLLMVPTFLLITAIAFFIMQMAPGGPLETKIGGGGGGSDSIAIQSITLEAKAAIAELYGFDKPIHERY